MTDDEVTDALLVMLQRRRRITMEEYIRRLKIKAMEAKESKSINWKEEGF